MAKGSVLPKRYKKHRLHGQWHNFFECHIKPDWLLI
ncbi:MAG: type II toxin-antitoxin system YafQ family toxin [Candidatus Marinimicrobia bacterium]|nr:type II toxin-antitoxin system YafQ family toxin [Candidatus Neomarinimicrobiota bacterium]